MRKLIFSVLLTILSFAVFAQDTKIRLQSSIRTKGFQKEGFARVIGPVFEHDGSTLAADSADVNFEANMFDAFGHIVITQPSGTTIYSDLLNYSGNTKLAILTNNVRLIDGNATLTTNVLTYNMGTRMGTYTGGGKIVDGENVLTSKNGYYFASTRDAYFRYNVVLTSPDALIKTDTLRYNANSKIAYFYGPTNIYGKDDTLYTENGTYNNATDQARFGKNNLYTQGSKSLKGDSLFYDRKAGYGKAMGNIFFVDTAEKALLRGGLGVYQKSDESILVTQNPYVVIISESDSAKVDSIWYTADTLFSKVVPTRDIKPYRKDELKSDTELSAEPPATAPQAPIAGAAPPRAAATPLSKDSLSLDVTVLRDTASRDSVAATKIGAPPKSVSLPAAGKPPANVTANALKDSVRVPSLAQPDTLPPDTARSRIIIAYHNAKIFKSDLQARADSMFFSYSDSTVRCYVNPMLWAQGSQLSGDTIYLQMKDKKLNNMLLQHNSLIVNVDDPDSTNFNQVKGKVITGFFKDNKLNQMFVDGNAETVFYVKEDSAYVGLNHSVSGRIKFNFLDGKVKNINLIKDVDANTTPMHELTEENRILEGFVWKPKDRPKSKEEILPQLTKSPARSKVPAKSSPAKTAPAKRVPVTSAPDKNEQGAGKL